MKEIIEQIGNREIEFRAWSNRDKCWCGAFSVHMTGLFSDLINAKQVNGQCISDAHWKDLREQKDIILMQYTGLKDKNGKKIFEGDVMRTATGYTFAVKMERFRMGNHEVFGYSDYGNECEIMGNAFENPELIK